VECIAHIIRFAGIHLQQGHSRITAGFLLEEVLTNMFISTGNAGQSK
jgi:hypothetical protein